MAVVKLLVKTLIALAAVAGGAWGIYCAEHHSAADQRLARLEAQKQQLEVEKQKLQTVVTRLSDEKRVADIIVEDQRYVDADAPAEGRATQRPGPIIATQPLEPAEPADPPAANANTHRKMLTTLLFVEYARDGSTLPPKEFTIEGSTAHIDAMVIKFDRGFVAENDALRGHSIALFCRLYGEGQAPDHAYRIDQPPCPPEFYRLSPPATADAAEQGEARASGGRLGTPPGTSKAAAQVAFENDLWKSFWRLADDKRYRQEKGVRIANGQGIWGPFMPDRIYTVTLDADGGLNLTSEPMQGIYREALRLRNSAADKP